MKKMPAIVVYLLGAAMVLGTTPISAITAEQEAKLLPADGMATHQFGRGVALDGDTAVIGATLDDDNGENSGAAYVFTRTGGVWTEQAKLLASDGAFDDRFGAIVALDGDTAVIGARFDDDNGTKSGSAYVFTRTGSVWTEQAKLLPADGAAYDHFGDGVVLDGNTTIIGARGDDDNGDSAGSAYVFTRTGGIWTEQAKLLPGDAAANDLFGRGIALDGDTAVIGAPWDDDNGDSAGSAYVFTRTGGIWTEQAKLLASDGAWQDGFGNSVALDGDTAVISAALDDDHGPYSGSAYVFTRTGAVWTEQSKLLPADGATSDEFGQWVALDGDTAVISAPFDDDNGLLSGSAYVFTRTGAVWTEQTKLLASDGGEDHRFGTCVALDGNTAIIGAFQDDDNGYQSGSAYVFRLIPPDADGDGIDDDVDYCAETMIPEAVPTNHLGVNRWALVNDDGMFDTTPPPGGDGGPEFEFTIENTRGCSCEQIIEAWALGWGHSKFGCSTGVMLQWIAAVWNYDMAEPETESQSNSGGLKTLDRGVDDPFTSGGTHGTSDPGEQQQRIRPRRQTPRRDGPSD